MPAGSLGSASAAHVNSSATRPCQSTTNILFNAPRATSLQTLLEMLPNYSVIKQFPKRRFVEEHAHMIPLPKHVRDVACVHREPDDV